MADIIFFLESVRPGVDFSKGDFEKIIYGFSENGVDWLFPNSEYPLLAQSTVCAPDCKLYSVIDLTLYAESTYWWGFFLWGTGAPNRVGRVRITPEISQPNGFLVQLLSGGTWRDVASDGTFDFLPDNVWPNVSPNSLIKVNDRYQLWASASDEEDSLGCDEEQAGSGSTILMRKVTEETMKEVENLLSITREMPTRNATGRLTPHVVIDAAGSTLLYSASTDRVCEDRNQAWTGSGNLFGGVEVIMTVLSDAAIEDRFSESFSRPSGVSLNGTTTELGGRNWSASQALQLTGRLGNSINIRK